MTTWMSFINGVSVIIIGAVLLANTAGALPWSIWINALVFWPLMVVAVGIRLMLPRTRRIPWVTVSVLAMVVLGAASSYGVLGLPRRGFSISIGWPMPFINCITGPVENIHLSVPADKDHETRSAALKLQFGAVDLSVRPGTSEIMEGNFEYVVTRPSLRADSRNDRTDITVNAAPGIPSGSNPTLKWDVRVNENITWDISIKGGATRADLDVSSIHVNSLDLSSGACTLSLALGDFPGRSHVDIDSGASSIRISIPESQGIRVSLSSSPAVKHNFAEAGLGKKGGSWESSNYQDAAGKTDVTISSGAAKITLERTPSAGTKTARLGG